MKVTALLENTSSCGLPVEHGLSLFVETAKCSFLFDMGKTDLFAQNAKTLGLDLNTADFAILSHGHYDHGGGLSVFLEKNDHASVYVNRHAFELHYSGTDRNIGLDLKLKDSDRLIYVDDEKKISEGLILFNCRTAEKIMDFDACGLNMIKDGKMQEEDFRHEQYLLVYEGGTKILFSGCSHRGILNIMHWFHPDIVIGGFHLYKHPLDEELVKYAKELNAYPTTYYTCHCTGTAQYQYMKEYIENVHYLSAGDTIVIGCR